jgi:hypothetical protein
MWTLIAQFNIFKYLFCGYWGVVFGYINAKMNFPYKRIYLIFLYVMATNIANVVSQVARS